MIPYFSFIISYFIFLIPDLCLVRCLVGQVFVKLVTRDLIYSWLDKHAQRSAMIDRREPKMDLGTFERVYLEQMQKDDKFWDDTDKEDDDYPQGGGRNAFASSVSWPLDCTHVYMYVYTVVDPGYTYRRYRTNSIKYTSRSYIYFAVNL